MVQTALDHVEDEARAKIIAELNGHYLECVKQANANHVIQVSRFERNQICVDTSS